MQLSFRAAMTIAFMLTTYITFAQGQTPSAFTNPDFYFDFSNIKSSGVSDFVVDQVTKNPMNAFTFEGKFILLLIGGIFNANQEVSIDQFD
jgi:hypothetical protein